MVRSRVRLFAKDEGGATAVEFAIVSLAFFSVMLGIFEFGRAFFLLNQANYAADFGIREYAYKGLTMTDTELAAAVESKMPSGGACVSCVTVSNTTIGTVVYKKIEVRPTVKLVIPILTDGNVIMQVDRLVPVPLP